MLYKTKVYKYLQISQPVQIGAVNYRNEDLYNHQNTSAYGQKFFYNSSFGWSFGGSSKNLLNPSTVLSPLQSTISFVPFLKSLMVGKPCTFTSSNSLAVESILAITTVSESAYFSPSLSQIGASCLQCPHLQMDKFSRGYFQLKLKLNN